MPVLRLSIVRGLAFVLGLSVTPFLHADNWQLDVEENGIKLYTKSGSNSPMKSYRAVTTIKATLSSLVGLLNDSSKFPEWMDKVLSVEKIRDISANESLVYQVIDAPWPAKDQDNILYSKWSQDPDTLVVTKKVLAEPQYLNEFDDRRRQQFYEAEWRLTPLKDGYVEVSYMAEINPGGEKVMEWMENMLAYDMPIKTMKNLRAKSLQSYSGVRVAYIKEPSRSELVMVTEE